MESAGWFTLERMTSPTHLPYSATEEGINVRLHVAASILAAVAAIAMITLGVMNGASLRQIISGAVFAFSASLLYLASSSYHHALDEKRRARLKVFDHCAIYLLIAGTYTPFTLVAMQGSSRGIIWFSVIWALAAAGIIFKLFYTGRFVLVSTLIYVAMGWLVVVDFKSAIGLIDPFSFKWMLAGGVAYTFGALIYLMKKLPYTHAIWHFFIVLANACHFVAVWPMVTLPR
jgi:hemolysin III